MAAPNMPSDMDQLFDFGEAAIPEMRQETAATNTATVKMHKPYYFTLPDLIAEAQAQEWNNDFSTWIPRYAKPETPCDYCRSRQLECFIYDSGKSTGCSPCNALFRPCSFSQPNNEKAKRDTALDTLDAVAEDSARTFGGLTGKKPMRCLGHVGPIENDDADTAPKKGAAAARFPRAAIKILKDWMIEHIDHPYPTDEEKEALKFQTGLSVGQISNWMANTRRRQKARPKRSASPSIRPSTEAIDIPAGRTWESLNPFERWKHSPPENEPAPMTAIAQAVKSFDPPETTSSLSIEAGSLTSSFKCRKVSSNDSASGSFSVFRAPSTTSLETGFTNVSSGSAQSVWSHGSRNSLGSLGSLNSKKDRRRRRRLPTRAPKQHDSAAGPRIFECTFCTDRFKSKYDWSRHEKTLHLSLEKWICAPLGDVITCTSSGQRKCTYCDAVDPSKEHLETHNHRTCEEKGLEARTFYRKDHLRQHLRLMHGCKMTPSMETWKAEAQFINSRCGFCGMNFDKWQDRVDHIAKEFRNGATMKNWKGCRGLDAHVAAHVQNAMPPYLISNESKSPFPFSATNSASMKHHAMYLQQNDLEYLIPGDKTSLVGVFIPHHMGDVSISYYNPPSASPTTGPQNTPQNMSSSSNSPHPNPNATCWEILTLRLGRFARQHIEKQGAESITDELLQQQARYILYECDDPWNQTAADNPEWLSLFKKAHGIETGPYPGVISQHDLLEDLGLQPSAVLDPSFNYNHFACGAPTGTSAQDLQTVADLALECSLTGSLALTQEAQRFSGQTNLSLPDLSSAGTSVSNAPATTFSALQGLNAPISEFTCTGNPAFLCVGENQELGFRAKNGKSTRINDKFPSSFVNTSMPTPIQEQSCTTAGEPMQDQFGFPAWDQFPTTTMGMSSSVPVTTAAFGDLNISTADAMSNLQATTWDDNDLTFNLDMDMDID
ncbi:hypothetical protein BDV96DRAFT_474367, partial [Lophiotrema nucula]